MSAEEEVREHEEEEEATTTEVEVRVRRPTREGIDSRCARVVYTQGDTWTTRRSMRRTTEGGLDSIGTIGRLENDDHDGDWGTIETGRRGE